MSKNNCTFARSEACWPDDAEDILSDNESDPDDAEDILSNNESDPDDYNDRNIQGKLFSAGGLSDLPDLGGQQDRRWGCFLSFVNNIQF